MKALGKREAWLVRARGEVIDRGFGKDYRDDMYVEWGSITKTVTAAAVGVLVERGHLDYAVPAREFVGGRLPDSVTIAALCQHTSGLPRVHPGMKAGVTSDPYRHTGPHVLVNFVAEFEPSMLESPGEVSYSNLGYAILGRIIEQTTNTSWARAVHQLVLDPWGLEEVTDQPPSDNVAAIRGFGGKQRAPWRLHGSVYAAAGGLSSRLDTLAKYGEITLENCGYDDPNRGWQRTADRWWHNGQTRDAGSCLVLEPGSGLVVATHTLARLPGAADRLASRLISQARWQDRSHG